MSNKKSAKRKAIEDCERNMKLPKWQKILEIESEMGPMIRLPLLNLDPGYDETVSYYPQLHTIYKDSNLDPNRSLNIFELNEKQILQYEKTFENNPVRYIELNPEKVLGLTVKEIVEKNNRKSTKKSYEKNLPAKKNGIITKQTIHNKMKQTMKFIAKCFPDADCENYDIFFPKTKVEIQRVEEAKDLKKKNFRSVYARVIPVYILPFLFKASNFTLQISSIKYFEDFKEQLNFFIQRNPKFDFYVETYFQFKTNLQTCVIKENIASTQKLNINITQCKQKIQYGNENDRRRKEEMKKLNKEIEQLKKDYQYLLNSIQKENIKP